MKKEFIVAVASIFVCMQSAYDTPESGHIVTVTKYPDPHVTSLPTTMADSSLFDTSFWISSSLHDVRANEKLIIPAVRVLMSTVFTKIEFFFITVIF